MNFESILSFTISLLFYVGAIADRSSAPSFIGHYSPISSRQHYFDDVSKSSSAAVHQKQNKRGKKLLKRRCSPCCRSSSSNSQCWVVKERLTKEDGYKVLTNDILPQNEYGARIGYGRDAQGLDSGVMVSASDPRLTHTYGEFPVESMDRLIDAGLKYYYANADNPSLKTIRMVDIGSGCGRLVFHTALTRHNNDSQNDNPSSWIIDGIEISNVLHKEALRASNRGVQSGLWFPSQESLSDTTTATSAHNLFTLRVGPVEEFPTVLNNANILFAYSTTWSTVGFSEQVGAMILDSSWNELLSRNCKIGSIAITTDRALDPLYGWKLLDQFDVSNPEVMGSTGYIQTLT